MIPWSKILNNIWSRLLILGIGLFLIHVLFQVLAQIYPLFKEGWIFGFFDFGLENNFPTFFSGFLFILMALSAWFCGISDKHNGVSKKSWLPWMFLSAFLLFFSLDEMTEIHEQLAGPTRELLEVGGFLFFAWVIPYALALLLLAIYFVPFILKLSKKTRFLIFSGAGLFLFGALGLEMVGARLYEAGASASISYGVVSSMEELFEIFGILIALKGLFNEVSLRISQIKDLGSA